jgi:hypothetical protein
MRNLRPLHFRYATDGGPHAIRPTLVLDILDFIEEKLREAISDEASQAGAVSEAAAALLLLRDRLRENEIVQAQFILVFSDYLYSPHAADWRTGLARMDRPAFERKLRPCWA